MICFSILDPLPLSLDVFYKVKRSCFFHENLVFKVIRHEKKNTKKERNIKQLELVTAIIIFWQSNPICDMITGTAGRMRGKSGPFILGGIHMTYHGYLPYLYLRRLSISDKRKHDLHAFSEWMLQHQQMDIKEVCCLYDSKFYSSKYNLDLNFI